MGRTRHLVFCTPIGNAPSTRIDHQKAFAKLAEKAGGPIGGVPARCLRFAFLMDKEHRSRRRHGMRPSRAEGSRTTSCSCDSPVEQPRTTTPASMA